MGANWDGAEMLDGDVAVDLEAGGRGYKGALDPDGTRHSCFALLMEKFAPAEDRQALARFTAYVDACDAYGSASRYLAPQAPKPAHWVLNEGSFLSVFKAWQFALQDDYLVLERMDEHLGFVLKLGKYRLRAEREADQQELLGGGTVAVVRNNRKLTNTLFERGVRIIVFVDGNGLGVTREIGEALRMDHPDFQEVVRRAGELEQWFKHPAGFLFSWGTRKTVNLTASKVDPRELAEVAIRLLREQDSKAA